jgi:hypothetical protein
MCNSRYRKVMRHPNSDPDSQLATTSSFQYTEWLRVTLSSARLSIRDVLRNQLVMHEEAYNTFAMCKNRPMDLHSTLHSSSQYVCALGISSEGQQYEIGVSLFSLVFAITSIRHALHRHHVPRSHRNLGLQDPESMHLCWQVQVLQRSANETIHN